MATLTITTALSQFNHLIMSGSLSIHNNISSRTVKPSSGVIDVDVSKSIPAGPGLLSSSKHEALPISGIPSASSVYAGLSLPAAVKIDFSNGWVLAISLFLLLIFVNRTFGPKRTMPNAPVVLFPGFWGKYFTSIMFIYKAPEVLELGYKRHGGQPFQVPTFWGTELFIGDLKRIQELADAPESSLSAKIATNQMAGLIWAFPDSFTDNSLRWSVIGEHVHQLVRKNLTQTVSKLIPSIMEEVEIVMDRVIGETPQGEFKSFKAHDTALKVVGQITNKVIVGAPLCRNTNFLQAVIDHGVSVCMGGQLIRLFPESIKRYVAKYLTTVSKATDAVVTHIAPIIRDLYERSRTENIDLLEGQPGYQTLTYWLTQRAIQKGFDWSPRMIATQLLFVNFGGIHTTAAAVGHLFYELGLRPEYIEPLKKEIEEKVAEHGWTKEGLDAMWKLDSFLRETQRLHPLSTAGLWRYARKDFTFSDGFHVPAGTWISAVSETLNKDDKHYANGTTFDGFRFARARETEGDKVKLTTTGILNMGFGTGSHACPGRFMAALELKLIVSHLVLNYEIRLEQGTRPVDFRMNVSTLPNISGKVLLRKKVVLKE